MKLFSTLSLIIGSFFVAVKGQGMILAYFRYTVSIPGAPDASYELVCNTPGLPSNHPMAIEACKELEAYVQLAETSKQQIDAVIRNALTPDHQNAYPPECGGIEGASFRISIGSINNEFVMGTDYDPEYRDYTYPSRCIMKMVAEQAKLSHFLPFSETDNSLVPPLNK
ncbi:hypothetical protein INT45_005275 [Circinella minor]|uniref:Uncharacterized protein n=1 Tax=Circinella minor TaxID=1195481 RepID=A0A8H7RUF7_9FUNG|nr:hypothetical protein INT45_005275 [Circinella minor]